MSASKRPITDERRRGVLLSAALLLFFSNAPFAAESSGDSVVVSGKIQTESELRAGWRTADGRYLKLQQLTRRTPYPYVLEQKDMRDRNIADDLRDYILTPSDVAEIERLRATLSAQLMADNLGAAKVTLASFTDIITGQVDTYRAIDNYWNMAGGRPPDLAPYLAYLQANKVERHHATEIEEAQRNFAQLIASAKFGDAMTQAYPALQALLKRAADEDAVDLQATIAGGKFTPFLFKVNSRPCSNPGVGTSGTATPKPMRRADPDRDYYPAQSKRMNEQGKVYLFGYVTAEGCMRRAEVLVSSGYPRLDGAAIDLMLDMLFQPAEQNGHAVPAEFSFVVNWDLHE